MTSSHDDSFESPSHFTLLSEETGAGRKPRIALMGEFSAGKSTLTNLLIGTRVLPVQVTATQLPPVCISHGDAPPFQVDLHDQAEPVDLNRLAEVSVEDTAYLRIFRDADILGLCDIIDMPGISDPRMGAEVWQRVIDYADGVIWCTHANQAWRQSEAAVWETLSPRLQKKSLLLVTRMDKIFEERDRLRLMKRIERETRDLFAARFPISLTDALAADEDREKWEESGAEAFVGGLVKLIDLLSKELEFAPAEEPRQTGEGEAPSRQVGPQEMDLPKPKPQIAPRRPVAAKSRAERPGDREVDADSRRAHGT